MADLQFILPGFPSNNITTVLERSLITTTDLLVCDAVEIAKRTGLGILDIRGFVGRVRDALDFECLGDNGGMNLVDVEEESGLQRGPDERIRNNEIQRQRLQQAGGLKGKRKLVRTGEELVSEWKVISTLDPGIDAALGGGIPIGYITEITGESGAGKTQLLLSLLLTAQLPPPHGLSRPTLYISTESALPTTRLQQILSSNPLLSTHQYQRAPRPQHPSSKTSGAQNFEVSLDHIHSIVTPDLESQDHILKFQVPIFVARHNIGLIVLDSVAANYRAEFERGAGGGGGSGGANMAKRSSELIKLGELFREIARKEGCAVVVANQVADRFSSPSFNQVGVSGGSERERKRKRADSHWEREGGGGTQSSPLAYRHAGRDKVISSIRNTPTSSIMGGGEPPSSMLAADELSVPHPGLLFPTIPTTTTTIHPPTNTNKTPSRNAKLTLPIQPQNSTPNPKSHNPVSVLAGRDIMTLDHQQRFFTGWGDNPPSSDHGQENGLELSLGTRDLPTAEENLKTPSLGLVWSTQIACRVVLKKKPIYSTIGDEATNSNKNSNQTPSREPGENTRREMSREAKGRGGNREQLRDEEDVNCNERILKGWRRWLRLVFAPWGPIGGVGGEVEYVIRGEGIRSVGSGEGNEDGDGDRDG